MNRQIRKISVFFILISSFLGCKQFSPDTLNKIIFERSKSFSPSEIWIMDEDGRNQTLLTKGDGVSLISPVWSPDGRKILFLRVDKEVSKIKKDLYVDIYVMDIRNKERKKLTNFSQLINTVPQWSPDGEKIAFSSNQNSKFQIYIMDINERKQYNLTNIGEDAIFPIWSPDGKKIIFMGGKMIDNSCKYSQKYSGFTLYLINIDDKIPRKLTDNFYSNEEPCWSPDGEKIVYTSFYKDNYEIFIMDKNGDNPIRLTNNSIRDYSPIWSPDGKKVAFISDGSLHVIDIDSKYQTRLTEKDQGYVVKPQWSPDSKKIAFVAEGDIYTIDIDGKHLKNLTNTPDWDESCPSWRPIAKK